MNPVSDKHSTLVQRDLSCLWHPCTQMKDHERELPMVAIRRGRGAWLEGMDGTRYLDAISSWWVNLFGHANPVISEAVSRQLAELEHVIFAGFTHEPAVQVAEEAQSAATIIRADESMTRLEESFTRFKQSFTRFEESIRRSEESIRRFEESIPPNEESILPGEQTFPQFLQDFRAGRPARVYRSTAGRTLDQAKAAKPLAGMTNLDNAFVGEDAFVESIWGSLEALER